MVAFVTSPVHREGSTLLRPPVGRWRPRTTVVSVAQTTPLPDPKHVKAQLVSERDPQNPRPSPPKHINVIPLVSELYDLWKYGASLTSRQREKYGPFWLGRFTGQPCLVVADATLCTAVMRSPELFPACFPFEGIAQVFGETTVATKEGQAHTSARKKINPAFSPALFPAYCTPTLKRADEFWAKLADMEISPSNPVTMDMRFRKQVFEGNVSMTSGINENLDQVFADFSIMCAGVFTLPVPLPSRPRQKALQSRDKVRKVLRQKVEERLVSHAELIARLRQFDDERIGIEAKRDVESGKVDLFTVILAQSGLPLAHDPKLEDDKYEKLLLDVMTDITLLWFAGYETSASALSAALFELGQHPDVVDRLRAEQDELSERTESVSVKNVMSDMPLLDAFLNETMRLHPPAIGVFRRVGPQGATLMGKDIEPNLPVIVDLSVPGRSPDIFPNPNEIDLDRYSAAVVGKDRANLARSSLMSFGVGHHRCVAAALSPVVMKCILSTLLRQYEFEVDPTSSSKFAVLPSHAPESGVPLVRLSRRFPK